RVQERVVMSASDPISVSDSDTVRAFVTAAHFSPEQVKQMLTEQPELLNVAYQWQEDDTETAIQAASHMGSVEIAEYLLEQGAPLAVYTAAMLGRVEDVRVMLADGLNNAKTRVAHGIPLMTHVALGGSIEIAALVRSAGGD